MLSWQAKTFNQLLRLTVKPLLKYYLTRYLATKDIRLIHRLRKLVNSFPWPLSKNAHVQQVVLNTVSAVQVTNNLITPTTTILYLHGGGYVLGLSKIYLELAYRLATACAAQIYIIDYRLLPEHSFNQITEDVLMAYNCLCAQQTADKLIIAGDSAGGGLVTSTLVELKKQHIKLPAAAICISPWVDMALTGESLQINKKTDPILSLPDKPFLLNDIDPHDPLASPLYADLSGLPPLLIQASNSEILLDDAKRLAEKASNAGVKVTLQLWDKVPHVWHLFAKFLPEGRAAIEKIGEFIKNLD